MKERFLAPFRTRWRDPRWFVPAIGVVAGLAVGLALVFGGGGGGDGGGRPAAPEPAGFRVSPEGQDVPRLMPVRVTFEKPPKERDAARLVSLQPATKGTYAWAGERTVIFQPDFPGLLRGVAYSINIAAAPEAGLAEAKSVRFTTAGKLAVVSVIPAPDDVEVPKNVQVLVQFSRSVAPLTLLGAQSTPPAVAFDPPLQGKGEWLNTSLYRFLPENLAPNTKYTAKVPTGLTSAADGVLDREYSWSFSTYGPAIDSVFPEDLTKFAGLGEQVIVRFNQPMDRNSVLGGFAVLAGGASVAGNFNWSDNDTVFTWTPSPSLNHATTYIVQLAPGLKGARGGVTAAARTTTFTTVGVPRVSQTEPRDGQSGAGRFGVRFTFSNPMNVDSLDGKVSISGIPADKVTGSAFGDQLSYYVNVSLQPSTRYTVSLAGGATDRYGQPLAPYTFSFTTGALESSVSFAIPNGVGTYSSSVEPLLYYHSTNTPTATFSLYPLTPDEAHLILVNNGLPPPTGPNTPWRPSQPARRTWTATNPATRDQVLVLSTSLSGGGPLPKGDYVVMSSSARFNSSLAFSVVDTAIVAKVAQDELLVWALDLDSGKPLANLALNAAAAVNGKESTQADTLVATNATTDANGLASFKLKQPSRDTVQYWFERPAFTVTTTAGSRKGVASTNWRQGTESYQANIPTEFMRRAYVGHLYTERPIYRPGEDVLYKGILREDDDATYAIPTGAPDVDLVIRDLQGKELTRSKVTLNSFGSVAGSFTLPTTAAIGDYYIQLEQNLKSATGGPFGPNRYPLAGVSFQVAEFRKPEFQVEVKADKDAYAAGDSIAATTTATFFFGGGVGNAPVEWNVFGTPFTPRFKGYEQYAFGDFDAVRREVVRDPQRGSGKAQTDARGVATFGVPAVLKGTEGAQQFGLSAVVKDQNAQTVAASTTVTVHPADGYAGVRPAQYVATAGKEATVQVVTVDNDGKPRPNTKVSIGLYDRTWVTTKEQTPEGARRYRSDPVDKIFDRREVTTDARGEATLTFVPRTGGQVRITAEYTDAKARTARSATSLWVSGSEYVSWQVTNDDTIKLVADKEKYEVGETAELLVPAPFAGAIGLVSVERGKVLSKEVRTFASNAERISIPVADNAVPDVFVSVVLFRPPTAEDPIPRYKVGYAELPVSTKTRELKVEIKPDRAQAKPGDRVGYDIKVTDSTGKGVKAELSVAVVDKAVLSLADERGLTGLKAFWFERGLGVATASSLNVSINRSNDVISEPRQGGKGGSGDEERLRQEFKNTAYWDGQLATKDDGTAHVDVTMPDNLTTWRFQARAISGNTMVGEATNELVSTQPLLLRPALPRFLRVGDRVNLRLLVRNATDKASDVTVSLAAEGVDLSGSADRSARVQPNESAVLEWPAAVNKEGTAKLTFTARGSGGLSDAVVQQLPVYLDVTPETTATNGVVTDASQLEAVYLPPFAIVDRGSLDVSVQPSLVGSLAGELPRFNRRPGEREEPTGRVAARVMADIAITRANRSANGNATQYDRQIEADLATLVGRQRPDGGFAWCTAAVCESDPQVTAWVLLAFGEARREGKSVDNTAVIRTTTYINAYINRLTDLQSPADVNEKAQMLYALDAGLDARGGVASNLSTMRALQQQYRAKLANWGRAYLILGFLQDGLTRDSPEVSQLLNDLAQGMKSSATGNHWEDERFARSAHTTTRTTALVLEALVRADPNHPLIEETVRWLMNARGAEGWTTDNEAATAILALSEFGAKTGELAADYTYRVQVNGKDLLDGAFKGATTAPVKKQEPLAALGAGKVSVVEFVRELTKPGRLYYTMALRYQTPARDVEALNRGFAVSHEYSLLDTPGTRVDHVKVGDTVRVKVTVIAPAEANYVVVDDLLPAGFEPVDPTLKITDPKLILQLDAERKKANRAAAVDYDAPWWGWYRSPWQQVETRDDRVTLRTTRLPRGVHEYTYYVRATAPGDFFVAPAVAQDSNFPEVFGRSDSGRMVVEP